MFGKDSKKNYAAHSGQNLCLRASYSKLQRIKCIELGFDLLFYTVVKLGLKCQEKSVD